jgi:hypothetical protein
VDLLRAWLHAFADTDYVLPPQPGENADLLIIASTRGLPTGWWVPAGAIDVRHERLRQTDPLALLRLRNSPEHEHDAETWCAEHRTARGSTPALAATGGNDGR